MWIRKGLRAFFIRTATRDMNSFFNYLKNVRAEMVHVVWPDPKQAVWHTILIVLISAVLALAIAGLDYVFTGVVSKLVGA